MILYEFKCIVILCNNFFCIMVIPENSKPSLLQCISNSIEAVNFFMKSQKRQKMVQQELSNVVTNVSTRRLEMNTHTKRDEYEKRGDSKFKPISFPIAINYWENKNNANQIQGAFLLARTPFLFLCLTRLPRIYMQTTPKSTYITTETK